MKGDVKVYPDVSALVGAVAEHFVSAAEAAIARNGRFAVVLSGGNTPRALHTLLASDAYRDRVDWDKTFVFWGDERCVPPDHADSNYKMAMDTLLSFVPLPIHQLFRMAGELTPDVAADQYEDQLREFFGDDQPPVFDLVLLGLGDDAHTASLFPHTTALAETERWAVANYVEKLNAWRLTLTYPAINAAHEVAFMVTGAGKDEALAHVFDADKSQVETYPAQKIQPQHGKLIWFVDADAAQKVSAN